MVSPKEVDDWIRAHRLQHLCIQDLLTLSPGDVMDVAIFDRNMEEYGMWDKIPGNTPMPASDMFRFNHHQIKMLENGNWVISMCGDEHKHPIHYNFESLATHWTWLGSYIGGDANPVICVKHEITRDGEDMPKGRKPFEINVADLHPLTRVGWRGPVMFWKYVENSNMPVFWRDPVE